jgi:hypothetical protein
MNTQKCRVQMLRVYFGEPEGEKCGLCDSCAGLDSEVFDPGSADARHGLHAATDFHARPRRRRRGRGGYDLPAPPPSQMPPAPVFETEIPSDILPPLAAYEVPAVAEGAATFDEARWEDAGGIAAAPLSGEVVIDPADDWASVDASAAAAAAEAPPSSDAVLPPDSDEAHDARWVAVRDANIRPYLDWRPGAPVSLPPITPRQQQQNGARPQHQQHHPGHHGRPGGHPGHNGPRDGGGGGRRRRRGRDRDRDRDRQRHDRPRDRNRGPRLPGFYNPGGD